MREFAGLFSNEPVSAKPASPLASGPRYRLLIVDDEPAIRSALKRVFHYQNYDITCVGDGHEALAELQRTPFHVMICDYMMPVMNGAELLRKAKEIHPATIRIMLTGHADTAAVMAAIKEGAVYKFILKPWNDDDLRVTVALAIEQYELLQKNRVLEQENARKAKEIAALSRLTVSNRSQIAIMLHKRNMINAQQVQELYRLQQQRKEPALKILLERNWVTEKTIHDLLRKDLLIQQVDLAEFAVDPAVAALLPRSFCERQLVVPLKIAGRRLTLAMADPLDAGLLEDLRFTAGLDIDPVLASVAAIAAKVKEIYGDAAVDFQDLETFALKEDPIEGIEIVIDDTDNETLEELLQDSQEPPAIRLVNAIILEAIRLGASDIHIHPRIKGVIVRYRIDGVLIDKINIPIPMLQPLVSRLKIMAELDISERRRPQDGRLTVKSPAKIVDLRISTLPTINGEKVVMRILDRNSPILKLESLGFSRPDLAKILNLADKPQGLVLTTGPTGSGKTTTLYGLLQHNATPEKNYVTIEDPVEYYMDTAGQVLIKERIGLTFPVVLRSILRQDPDVILLGEIRDFETAEVAFHAALTGHLVFSTLHTNSAVATISRLFDLGLKPFVVSTALEGIVAQRLVRKVCEHCAQPVRVDKQHLARLGAGYADWDIEGRAGCGCAYCHGTGYKGRLGIYEVLVPNDEMRALIAQGGSGLELSRMARAAGMTSLLDDAMEKLKLGLTTVEEVLRVLGPQ